MQRWITRAVLWAPVVAAVVFLLVMLINQGEIRDGLNAHADFASAPVLAELITEAPPGSTLVLGDYPWYEAFWLLRATSWLPAHHFVWEMVPFVLWFATALLVGGAVRRVSGSQWAGLTATALVICGGIGMRGPLWSLNTHGLAAFHVALIGAWLALVTGAQARWLHGARGWGLALALGLVTAVGATDPLVLALGVVPLLIAPAVLWLWRGEAALLQRSSFASAVAVAGASLLDTLAQEASIAWTDKPLKFVDYDRVVDQLGLLPGIAARMASVSPFGQEVTPGLVLAMVAAATAFLATAVVLVTSVRLFKRTLWPERFGAGGSERRGSAADEPDLDLSFAVAIVFWFSVVSINLTAFVLTNAAFDIYGGRYLVSGWMAVCALIPLLAVRVNLRWLAGATATVLCVASTYHLVLHPSPTFEGRWPTRQLADDVAEFTQANGARYGYAGFWDSMPLTWHSRFDTQVYPVARCGEQNCRFNQHYIDHWYRPKAGRSYLVLDPTQTGQPVADPAYGTPIATRQFGPVTVYVYDRDIAAQIR